VLIVRLLCALATLREPFAVSRRSHAKAPRRKEDCDQPARSSASRGAREGARERKNLDVGAPLWVPRPFLDCGKKGFWPWREALGATTPRDNTASGERGEVSPEYVAPVSRPACRYGWPDSAPQSTVLPSSARVSREHARSTAGKAGAQELMPLARRGPRKNHDEP